MCGPGGARGQGRSEGHKGASRNERKLAETPPEAHHRRGQAVSAPAGKRTKADLLRRMGVAAKATTWWWKNEDADWPDLHRALDTLEEAHIDLGNERHRAFVLAIGKRHADFEAYTRSGHRSRDRRDLETLEKLYRVVLRITDLNSRGQAEQVRQGILGELRAEMARLHDKVGPRAPGRGHPVDWDLRKSIEERPPGYFVPWALRQTNASTARVETAEARRIVWDADAIAATLLLTGVRRRESLDAVKRAIRATVRRVEHFNDELAELYKRIQRLRAARKS